MESIALIFTAKNSQAIKISNEALANMFEFRQLRADQSEAGGMLLGRLVNGGENVVVDEATSPSRTDKRGRFNFFRSKKSAQRRVNAAWEESKQTRNYLGEWHTHPEDHPSPSGHDIANWKKIVAASKFEQSFLIFVIVGRKSTKAWCVYKDYQVPTELCESSELPKEDHS